MKTYEVDVGGKTYEVDAPDPNVAWQYANQHHRAQQVKLEEAGKAKGGEFKIGEAGFRPAAAEVAKETGVGGRFLQGVGETFDRAAYGLEGLFRENSPEVRKRLEQNKVQAEEGGVPAVAGQVAGDLAITAPLMAVPGAAAPVVAAKLPMALKVAQAARAIPGAELAGRTAAVVAPPAALGALMNPEDRAQGAMYGAAGGVAGAGINRAVGGVLKPLVSREGAELIEQGIQPTPGQAIGGVVGRLEEKVGSIPFVGDIIGRSRNRAIEEFNEALTGRVAKEIGAPGLPRAAGRKLGEVGDEALLELRQKIGSVYDNVLDQVPSLRIEPKLIAGKLQQIIDDPALALSDESAKRLANYVNKNMLAREPDITGAVAKRIESDLGKAVTRFKAGNATAEERAYGEALEQLHSFWREGITNAVPPQLQAQLRAANAAWRGLQPLDQAAAAATSQLRDKQGVFTPRVLRSALARGDKSQGDNVLRTLQRQPVSAAQNPYEYAASMSRAGRTLGDVVPDSGTPTRLLASAGLLGGAGAGAGALVGGLPAAMALGGGAAAAYSRAGAALLTRGAFPASREAVAAWLAQQGVPRNAIPALTEQTLAAYGRSRTPQPKQRMN